MPPEDDVPAAAAEPKSSARPVASVASVVSQARRDADAVRKEVEAISAAHLKALLSDKSLFLAEHLDDPELTVEDHDRLLRTLHARRTKPKSRRPWLVWPSWSMRRIWRVILIGTLFALLIGVPLRNTAEFAVVNARYKTRVIWPSGDTQIVSLKPGDILYVRRWLRRTPVAVWWDEKSNAYATATIPRSGINFPRFPQLDW